MKVNFIDEYDEELLEIESGPIPRVDDLVIIDEEKYYVTDVIWNINNRDVSVMISETKNHKRKEPPLKEDGYSDKAREAIESANKALKEVKSLRNEVSNIRQYLKEKKK